MTTQYTIQLGLFDKDTKRQEIDTTTATNLIHKIALTHSINGLSWFNGGGMYTHDNGDIIYEPNITIIIYGVDTTTAKAFTTTLKTRFNQELIYLSEQKIKSTAI